MDENNEFRENTEINTHETHHHTYNNCCKSDWIKCLMTGLLVFLGAFLAFYTLGDFYMKRHIPHIPIPPMQQMQREFDRMDKDFIREQRKLNKEFQKNFDNNRVFMENQGIVNMSENDDVYKLIIDLKPFDNNEKNVQVNTNGQKMTIEGAGITTTKNGEKMVRVSQSYMFDKKVKLNEMTKFREGNNLIITIPIDD